MLGEQTDRQAVSRRPDEQRSLRLKFITAVLMKIPTFRDMTPTDSYRVTDVSAGPVLVTDRAVQAHCSLVPNSVLVVL